MKKNKNINDSQISLFDMCFEEPIVEDCSGSLEVNISSEDVVKVAIDEVTIDTTEDLSYMDNSIINRYKNKAKRIVKMASNRYCVEVEEGVIALTGKGEEDYTREGIINVIPLDKILYSIKDVEVNNKQKDILFNITNSDEDRVSKVIKRYGDQSYIIFYENSNVSYINAEGWLIPCIGDITYKDSEVVYSVCGNENKEEIVKEEIVKEEIVKEEVVKEEVVKEEVVKFDINEEVALVYNGENHIGKVVSVYNNGYTYNVIFDNKHTAFYVDKLFKI